MMEVEESTLDKKLPEELWRKIFELIPKKNHENISLVNSFFYRIICDMEKYQRKLIVTSDNVSFKGV